MDLGIPMPFLAVNFRLFVQYNWRKMKGNFELRLCFQLILKWSYWSFSKYGGELLRSGRKKAN